MGSGIVERDWDFESEDEALACVRELLGQGWRTDQLVMIFDDPALADEELPPGVTGDELTRRVEATNLDRSCQGGWHQDSKDRSS